jgi:hypothetical protein
MRRSPSSSRFLALAAVAAMALTVPAAAQAGAHEYWTRGRVVVRTPLRHHGAVPVGRVVAPRVVVGPRVVTVRERGRWAPVREGRVVYEPYRYRHYPRAFPLVAPLGVVVRPYPACDGHMFISAPLPLPRISVRIGF